MGQPVWEKITQDGKPFGYQSQGEKDALRKVKELEKEVEFLKAENQQLKDLLEEETK